jgi:hypothetical protein
MDSTPPPALDPDALLRAAGEFGAACIAQLAPVMQSAAEFGAALAAANRAVSASLGSQLEELAAWKPGPRGERGDPCGDFYPPVQLRR